MVPPSRSASAFYMFNVSCALPSGPGGEGGEVREVKETFPLGTEGLS